MGALLRTGACLLAMLGLATPAAAQFGGPKKKLKAEAASEGAKQAGVSDDPPRSLDLAEDVVEREVPRHYRASRPSSSASSTAAASNNRSRTAARRSAAMRAWIASTATSCIDRCSRAACSRSASVSSGLSLTTNAISE